MYCYVFWFPQDCFRLCSSGLKPPRIVQLILQQNQLSQWSQNHIYLSVHCENQFCLNCRRWFQFHRSSIASSQFVRHGIILRLYLLIRNTHALYLKIDNLGLRKDCWGILYKITFLIVTLHVIPPLSASMILKIKEKKRINRNKLGKREGRGKRSREGNVFCVVFSAAFTSADFFKWGADGRCPRERDVLYRASNFCERPKITGRRVPDVAENRNFENRSPFVTAAPIRRPCLRLLFERTKNGDVFVTKGIHSNVRLPKYVMFPGFIACTHLINEISPFEKIHKKRRN